MVNATQYIQWNSRYEWIWRVISLFLTYHTLSISSYNSAGLVAITVAAKLAIYLPCLHGIHTLSDIKARESGL